MTTNYFDAVGLPLMGNGMRNRFWSGFAKLLPWRRGVLMAFFLSTRMFGQTGLQPMPVAVNRDSTIVKLADAYRKAVLDGDTAGVVAFYRDDAIEMPPFQPPIVGRAAIEQFYRKMFQGPVKVTGFTFSHTETIHGDAAYDVGSYKRTMSGAPTEPIEATGPYVVMLKRTDGAWKLAYIIYNCDCPPPGPPPSAPVHIARGTSCVLEIGAPHRSIGGVPPQLDGPPPLSIDTLPCSALTATNYWNPLL